MGHHSLLIWILGTHLLYVENTTPKKPRTLSSTTDHSKVTVKTHDSFLELYTQFTITAETAGQWMHPVVQADSGGKRPKGNHFPMKSRCKLSTQIRPWLHSVGTMVIDTVSAIVSVCLRVRREHTGKSMVLRPFRTSEDIGGVGASSCRERSEMFVTRPSSHPL